MASLDRNLRKELENAVNDARREAEAGARAALVALGVADAKAPSGADAVLRRRLRAHGRQLGDMLDDKKSSQSIDRLAGECAYEHWHRLLFARFLAENDLLVEPESGMAVSLDECRELAREQSKDWLVLASDFAQRMLPQIFRASDPVLEVALPPEKRQKLEAILESLAREVFLADDSLGWVYQFWQAEQKKAVNDSGDKIGADELPAVTQLFTEDYMVLFLLHNTLGAWWAGKVLAARPGVATLAATEDECRAACAVQGIEWSYLRFVREGDAWRPAAGTFPGWPTAAKDLTVLDPCMGSGHFLAFALPILVALRREEEALTVAEAVDAALRDNLFGLELDQRCTQIAAFNIGFTAWKLAGYRPLPALNLACAGLGINAPVSAWTALAADDAPAQNAMTQLYELFRRAPTLGSLIDSTRVGGELFVANFEKFQRLVSSALASEDSDGAELAVVAQGIAKAASILAQRYTLVATNVPYLGRAKQDACLQQFCECFHQDAKADLATCFIERCVSLTRPGGGAALVTPQNWLYIKTYRALRRRLLTSLTWNSVALLGAGAFETISGEAVNVALLTMTNAAPAEGRIAALDARSLAQVSEKGRYLRAGSVVVASQSDSDQRSDYRLALQERSEFPLMERFAECLQGLSTGDNPRLVRAFWELPSIRPGWRFVQGTTDDGALFGGKTQVLWFGQLERELSALGGAIRGSGAWGRRAIAVNRMGDLSPAIMHGEAFDINIAAVVPREAAYYLPLLAYLESKDFASEVRKLDPKMNVTNATLGKVPFDLARWQAKAVERFPDGVPTPPPSIDPAQWIFSGDPTRAGGQSLQVAVGRLVDYRWPRQSGSSFMDCDSTAADLFFSHADSDGIVCLPSLRGEAPAAERVRALLAVAFDAEWSPRKLTELLANAGFSGKSLDDWLRDGFFEQHCAVFKQRPFVWQVWDGRRDGFSALVNYHKLAGADGEGRRTLEKLTHTYLGDWLDRQRADQKAGVEGADGRLAAAEHLKRELEKILDGEPPYDIFVRWKPLHRQPLGWEPDIDDGVRVNIRPFTTAKPLNARGKNASILRVSPNIRWDKDRGKEPMRERANFPWFWGWDESAEDFLGGKEFDGKRSNDLHYMRATKLAARERAKGGES